MAEDAGLGGLYLVACLGESPYRSQVADGFDAGVLFRLPFTRTTTVKVRDRLIARGLARGPRRYPYLDVLADPPAEFTGLALPRGVPQLGQHAPVGTARRGGDRVYARAVRAPMCAGRSSWWPAIRPTSRWWW